MDDYDDQDFDDGVDPDGDDEREAARGTSECDGLCDPMCDWCLVGHACPADCATGPCPYDLLAAQQSGRA